MIIEQLVETVYSITDDSGFLALINADKYNSFIGEGWSFEQLQQRFTEQTIARNLLIWTTGGEGFYKVAVLRHPSDDKPFRGVHGEIEVTNELLYLTNYEDLTMAAQFPDEKLPANNSKAIRIKLRNGLYGVLIRQMFNPEFAIDEDDRIGFEVVFSEIAR